VRRPRPTSSLVGLSRGVADPGGQGRHSEASGRAVSGASSAHSWIVTAAETGHTACAPLAARVTSRPVRRSTTRAVEFGDDHAALDQTELDALLAATGVGRRRHRPATLERAARVRQLRDVDQSPWKTIAATMSIAESMAIYLHRVEPEVPAIADDIARVERVMYLTAAMTGMHQAELLALRWMDGDWLAHRVRVRRNFVRGRPGTPKSKRSSRRIPLADQVACELELLFQSSARPYRFPHRKRILFAFARIPEATPGQKACSRCAF
jgi:integrase